MDSDTVLSLQYEAQHFGFHPRLFVDGVYNILYEKICAGLNQFKEYLVQEFSDAMPPYQIESQTDSLYKELIRRLDKTIDKLEVYMNINVFPIPNHVVLPEDEVHIKNPCSKSDMKMLDKEIKELETKIIEEQKRKCILKQHIAEQMNVKQDLLDIQQKLQNLLCIASEEGLTAEIVKCTATKWLELFSILKQPFPPSV